MFKDFNWREAHAYFAGYDDGLAGTDALRATWSEWPEAYERGRVAGTAKLRRFAKSSGEQ